MISTSKSGTLWNIVEHWKRHSKLKDGSAIAGRVQNRKTAVKNDPRLVAAARELKDRWLEKVNGGLYLPIANGKYEVSRGIGDGRMTIAGDLQEDGIRSG